MSRLVLVFALILAAAAAAQPTEMPGWRVHETSHAYKALID